VLADDCLPFNKVLFGDDFPYIMASLFLTLRNASELSGRLTRWDIKSAGL